MIRLRRAIAIPLAGIFIILSLLVLLAFRVNATVGNPDFYSEQLQQADVYSFIYDAVLPEVMEEAGIGEEDGEASTIMAPLKPHLATVVRQTLPPEWLQSQVEHAVNEVVPYVWGETDTFRIDIQLQDRAEAAGEAIKNVLQQEDVFPVLYGQLIASIADEVASAEEGVPAMLAASEEEIELMLRRVLPEDWLLEQIGRAVDEAVPYLSKEREHFALEVEISRPLDELEEVLADSLSGQEAYDRLFMEMLAPALQANLEEITYFPIDVELTEEEIIAVAGEAIPLEVYQALVHDLVGQVFAYIRGEQEDLEVTISLAEHKPGIAVALGQVVDEKIEASFDSLPACSGAQLLKLLSDPSLENLLCRPAGISYQEFKELVNLEPGNLVQPVIEMGIPDEWILTEAELGRLFGGTADDNVLAQTRGLVQEGLTFTEEDLQEAMGADAAALEDIRQMIADGLTFTDQDLKQLMSDGGADGSGEQMAVFEELRSNLGVAKKWLNFIWLAPLLLLVAIGALGGQRWSSRLIWAAAVLGVMAIIAYIIFGPVFSATAQPEIDRTVTTEFGQTEGIASLVAQKGVAVVQNAIGSFISGLKNQAIAIAIASVVLIGVGVVLHNWDRIRGNS